MIWPFLKFRVISKIRDVTNHDYSWIYCGRVFQSQSTMAFIAVDVVVFEIIAKNDI